jgi:hypothetical protein
MANISTRSNNGAFLQCCSTKLLIVLLVVYISNIRSHKLDQEQYDMERYGVTSLKDIKLVRPGDTGMKSIVKVRPAESNATLAKQPPRLAELFDTMLLELQGSDKADKAADPMTNLGGQTLVMLALVGIKFWAQCCGVDSPNEGEISNKDTYKLHDAFNYPF